MKTKEEFKERFRQLEKMSNDSFNSNLKKIDRTDLEDLFRYAINHMMFLEMCVLNADNVYVPPENLLFDLEHIRIVITDQRSI